MRGYAQLIRKPQVDSIAGIAGFFIEHSGPINGVLTQD